MSPSQPEASVVTAPPLRLGASACLLGMNVRYDGGHKRDDFVALLARHCEVRTVCPEVEVGLGVPRETIHLVRRAGQIHLVTVKTERDLSAEMTAYATHQADTISGWALDGFIVKKDSPSCGLERVRVYDGPATPPTRDGQGMFTAALLARCPLLPVEEEGRLRDGRIRDNFLTRMVAYRRVRRFFSSADGPHRWTLGGLVAFHAREKLLLLAHSPARYRQLGQLVASGKSLDRQELAERYTTLFSQALRRVPQVGQHVNVLEHIAGYFRTLAPSEERRELSEAIADYRKNRVPRLVPLALLGHQARRHRIDYLTAQHYLLPYPKELWSEPAS